MNADIAVIHRHLLAWFDQAQRPMPWRAIYPAPADPYHVLASEAMLQQTQVATVIPYFLRFVAAFPTVAALAAAEEQQVLRLWQGLGYYRRAKNLHKAAQVIVAEHGGHIPGTVAQLLELPGIGPYTAGAIASIAFNQHAPLVDGNVIRVMARVFGLEEVADTPAAKKKIWALAEAFAQGPRPGCANQGLMELGALICTPKNTRCTDCPLKKDCTGYALGKVEILPILTPKKKPLHVAHRILAITKNGKQLFEKRPDTGLWAGMWQMPTLETPKLAPAEWFLEQYGLQLGNLKKTGQFKHQTTHRTIAFEVWSAQVIGGRLKPSLAQWRIAGAVDDLPLAKPQLTALEMILK